MGELADAVGFGVKKTIGLLKKPHASKFIVYKQTYHYDSAKGKRIKGKCFFQVSLTDPLTPEDEAELLRQNIHSDVSKREQPKSQNDRKISLQKERSKCRKHLNIYNTFNNINIPATTKDNIMIAKKKGEQIQRSKSEQNLIQAVRKALKNRISERKVIELIEKTGSQNVENQLKWLPHRDNSWARKGPVVAFIVYCEQQLEEPIELKRQREEHRWSSEIIENDRQVNKTYRLDRQREYAARRARYEKPEQYDDLFHQIIEKLEPRSSPAKVLLQSCFIGEIKINSSSKTLIIDAPNGFSRNFLQSRYSRRASVEINNLELEFVQYSTCF